MLTALSSPIIINIHSNSLFSLNAGFVTTLALRNTTLASEYLLSFVP